MRALPLSHPDGYDRAMLFTFVVTSGTKSFTTQHHADNLEAAREALLGSSGFRVDDGANVALSAVYAAIARSKYSPADPVGDSSPCWARAITGRLQRYFSYPRRRPCVLRLSV